LHKQLHTSCNALRILARNIGCCEIAAPGIYFRLFPIKFGMVRVGEFGMDDAAGLVSSPF